MCCFLYIHAVVVFIYKQQYIYTDENTEPYCLEAIHLGRTILHLYTTIGHVISLQMSLATQF
jgi:predicted RNA polymerase sigma factor